MVTRARDLKRNFKLPSGKPWRRTCRRKPHSILWHYLHLSKVIHDLEWNHLLRSYFTNTVKVTFHAIFSHHPDASQKLWVSEAVDWRSCLLIYHPVAQNQNAFKWTIRCFTKPKYSENCAILKPLRSPQWGPQIWRKKWPIWEGVLSDLSGQSRHFFGAVKLWTQIWETIKIPIYFAPWMVMEKWNVNQFCETGFA